MGGLDVVNLCSVAKVLWEFRGVQEGLFIPIGSDPEDDVQLGGPSRMKEVIPGFRPQTLFTCAHLGTGTEGSLH